MSEKPVVTSEYEGRFYARPAYKGFLLNDTTDPFPEQSLDEVGYTLLSEAVSHLSEGGGRIRVKIELLSVDGRA